MEVGGSDNFLLESFLGMTSFSLPGHWKMVCAKMWMWRICSGLFTSPPYVNYHFTRLQRHQPAEDEKNDIHLGLVTKILLHLSYQYYEYQHIATLFSYITTTTPMSFRGEIYVMTRVWPASAVTVRLI